MESVNGWVNALARAMEDDICCWCGDMLDEGSYKIEEDGWYCHFDSSNEPVGSCWEQRICVDFPEFVEWLAWGHECDGCVVSEEGECQCTDGWKIS